MAAGADGLDYGQVLAGARDRNNVLRPMVVDTDGKLVGVYQADPFFIEQPVVDVTAATPTLLLAATAGRRHYITDVVIENKGATAISVAILDNATRLISATVPMASSLAIPILTPLRGSTNTAMNVLLSMAGNVTVSTQGYSAVA